LIKKEKKLISELLWNNDECAVFFHSPLTIDNFGFLKKYFSSFFFFHFSLFAVSEGNDGK
jgi:hypothetical protein